MSARQRQLTLTGSFHMKTEPRPRRTIIAVSHLTGGRGTFAKSLIEHIINQASDVEAGELYSYVGAVSACRSLQPPGPSRARPQDGKMGGGGGPWGCRRSGRERRRLARDGLCGSVVVCRAHWSASESVIRGSPASLTARRIPRDLPYESTSLTWTTPS
jgi:hypothetical protein